MYKTSIQSQAFDEIRTVSLLNILSWIPMPCLTPMQTHSKQKYHGNLASECPQKLPEQQTNSDLVYPIK